MKKILLSVFFIIIITRASAENIFDFSWNFGNIGLGVNCSGSNDDNIELCVSFLNFIIEQKDINIGFEFSPVKYWHFFELQNEPETKYNGERFSFINTNMYWDLIRNNNILLGPFVSMNYFFINSLSGINMNECILSGGLRFSFKTKHIIISNKYNDQIFSTEIGYRNLFGNNKFYFSINIDLILGMIGIIDAARMGIPGGARN